MKNIIKVVILLGLFLQGSVASRVESGGWAWSDDSQETVRLQTISKRVGHPWPYWEVLESVEIGHLWKVVTARETVIKPLYLSLSMGFWMVLIYLLDTFWPWEVDVSDA